MVYIVTLEHYICSVLATYLPPANEVWGKLMFLHLCVILFTGGSAQPPWMQTPSQSKYFPWLDRPPPDADPPGVGQTPPLDADPAPGLGRPPSMQPRPRVGKTPPPRGLGRPPQPIRSTSGRYASYWNAYYFYLDLPV